MQLILETIPVIHQEDKEELLKVMPMFINSTWEVRKPLRKLLPEVDSEGTVVATGSAASSRGSSRLPCRQSFPWGVTGAVLQGQGHKRWRRGFRSLGAAAGGPSCSSHVPTAVPCPGPSSLSRPGLRSRCCPLLTGSSEGEVLFQGALKVHPWLPTPLLEL